LNQHSWQRFWFTDIPPHTYALLRILLGVLGGASLLGLRQVSLFWALDGLVPADDNGLGLKALVISYGLGGVAGTALFATALASFASMAVGFQTTVAVALALAMSLVQVAWNRLPLSGAHAAIQMVLFCLIWADCGSVWSLDAWLARHAHAGVGNDDVPMASIAPLRLVRFQVAMIYLNSGLWKLFNEHWRDGSALHYILNTNLYRRFPSGLPAALDSVATAGTYATLVWELAFAVMVLWTPTRKIALLAGVLIHVGMLATIEVGPFSWVMLATYVGFLDPLHVPSMPAKFLAIVRGSDQALKAAGE
jgi:hypothetical protein